MDAPYVNVCTLRRDWRLRTTSCHWGKRYGGVADDVLPLRERMASIGAQVPWGSLLSGLASRLAGSMATIGESVAIWAIKRTYQPSTLKRYGVTRRPHPARRVSDGWLMDRKRQCGFLSRMADRHGRKVLARRRAKGRWVLC